MNSRVKTRGGVALLLVLVSLAFVSVISVEIIFSSRVDIRISRNARDRLQAHYLALSAAKLGLLRVQIYQEIQSQLLTGKIPSGFIAPEQLNQVWQFPFPILPLDKNSPTTQHWPGYQTHTVSSEGSKIPINLLDKNIHRESNTKKADAVKKELEKVINSFKEDEEFDAIYPDLRAEELIDPLIDWIDEDSIKQNGGDEIGDYDSRDDVYYPRNDRITQLSEIAMIYNWTDDLLKRIAPFISTLNMGLEVNPNYLPLERLAMYSDPPLSREDLAVIEKQRRTEPFKTLQDLETFVRTSPEIRNGQAFDISSLTTAQMEKAFIIEGKGVVGEASRSYKLGVRMDQESKKDGTKTVETVTQPVIVFVEEGL